MAARKEAERVRQLVYFRQALTGQIVQMYAREPDDFDQLYQLVLNRFGSKEVAAAMVAGTKAYRADSHAPTVVLALPVAWGKAVNGMQAGLRFGLQNRDYRVGEQINFTLLVRNTGDNTITVEDYVPMAGWAPTVRTIDGKSLPVYAPPVRMPVQSRRSVLKPGDTLDVGEVFLQIDAEAEASGDIPHVNLTPGKYLVSQSYHFQDAPGSPWSGELTTGELTLSVVAEDRPAKNKGPASQPATHPADAATAPANNQMTLQGAQVTNESLGKLKGLRLNSLMLYQTGVTDEGLGRLAEVDSLKRLLLRTPGIKGPGLAKLKGVHGLESLELMGAFVGEESLVHLAELPDLRELSVSFMPLTEAGLAQIGKMTNLRRLNLYGCPVTDAGLAKLEPLAGLEAMDLTNCPVTDAGLARLKAMPKLKALSIGCSSSDTGRITDAGLAQLAGLKDLEELDLTWQLSVSSEGMQHLAGLKHLKSLGLHGTNVSVQAIAQMPQIESLRLSSGQVQAGLEHLRAMKKLTNLMVYGELDIMGMLPGRVDNGFHSTSHSSLDGLKRLQEALPRCSVSVMD